jgi:hypothetical protein
VNGTWLELPGTENEFSINTLDHYTGAFNMSVLATINDETSGGDKDYVILETSVPVISDSVADIGSLIAALSGVDTFNAVVYVVSFDTNIKPDCIHFVSFGCF